MVSIATSFWLITAVGAFVIGLSVGQRSMLRRSDIELESVQAMLLFNKIDDERFLGELLRKGCNETASEHVKFLVDVDMQLMHRFVVGGKMGAASAYIQTRNPEILKEAATYSPRFPNPWAEKTCN